MHVKPSGCPTSMFADGMTMLVQLESALHLTNSQFYDFCRLNRELRIERTAAGGLSIMPPAGWDSNRKNAEINVQLGNWTKRNGTDEYMANGAELGWLIDSLNRQAFVYPPDGQVECLEAPDSLYADPLLPGFQLRMADIR